jgi:hypothetical protein
MDHSSELCHYWHGTVAGDGSSLSFTRPGVILHESRGVTAEIATSTNSDKIAVALYYLGDDYTCNWPDPSNTILLTSNDDGLTWDTLYITSNGPDMRVDPKDTFFYSVIYTDSLGEPILDSLGEYTYGVDTFVCYTRPKGAVSIIFDNDDYVHVVWDEGTYSPDSCTGNSVSSWAMSDIYHWSERTGEINPVLSAYPNYPSHPSPGGDANNPRYFESSARPSLSVGPDGTLYCIWQQYFGELWWRASRDESDTSIIFYDVSTGAFANNEIFLTYSSDNGRTWKGPVDVSNTYTPQCAAGSCKSELDATLTKISNDKIHLFWVEDRDPGIAINSYGEYTNNPVKYVSIPTSVVKANANRVDRDVMRLYPGEGIKESGADLPFSMTLRQNFPNPFNSTTTFFYEIEEPGKYSLEIYDINGKLVNVIMNGTMNRGKYISSWEGKDLSGQSVASGTYLFRLRNEAGYALVRKMTLIK